MQQEIPATHFFFCPAGLLPADTGRSTRYSYRALASVTVGRLDIHMEANPNSLLLMAAI